MKNFSFKKFSFILFFLPSICFAKDWNFDVLMDGKLIGEHTFQLKEEEKFHQLTSNANFKVTVLSIPVYKYKHISQELWNKNCLIDKRFNEDGEMITKLLENLKPIHLS